MCCLGWGKEDVASFLCKGGWGARLPACLPTRPAAIHPVLEELPEEFISESPKAKGAVWGIGMGLCSCWSLFTMGIAELYFFPGVNNLSNYSHNYRWGN